MVVKILTDEAYIKGELVKLQKRKIDGRDVIRQGKKTYDITIELGNGVKVSVEGVPEGDFESEEK